MRARRYHTRTVPKFLVHHEESGFVTRDGGEFIGYVLRMLRCPGTHASMRLQARRFALDASCDSVDCLGNITRLSRATPAEQSGQPTTPRRSSNSVPEV
jgi:hypothetical protein